MDNATLDSYLRDWLESSTALLKQPGAHYSTSYAKSPVTRAGRRRQFPGARWVMVEADGDLVVMVGMRPGRLEALELDGFVTIEANNLNGQASAFWVRLGLGRWECIVRDSGPLRPD